MGLAKMAAAVLALALAAPMAAHADPNPWWSGFIGQGKLVPLGDGRALYLYCEGAGAPVVVMDSGLGDDASSWRQVQDQIAAKAKTRVCAYDRAGYGRSTGPAGPRDTKTEAADIAQMLQAAKLPGPYVLVGHSMASFNLRLFAYQHPKEVAGIVLVDPSADNQMAVIAANSPSTLKMQEAQNAHTHACAAPDASPAMLKSCAGPPPADLPPELSGKGVGIPPAGYYAAQAAELDAFATIDSKQTVAAKRKLGAMPLIVLTASDTTKAPGLPQAEIDAGAKAWSRLHDEIAALSTKGVNRLVEGSGHYIQKQKPQVVIDAVAEVVAAARANR
ncbi:alpha/beta hydrolase [Phenylobacterium sp.]|uniref:alpha/beta hydrolase n=1 Tax=Phenylobacterium sp. TaxID=1871053 RepID=UPI002BD64FD8|nr:alpha/beta hydrolase [Phenylobacterium sp.]HLZ75031.1 alpha/beta hydrolase [Phenylobacterium sp.]